MHMRISPALVVACLALAVGLGGVGYAAVSLPRNSVGPAQLKKNSVSGPKVKNKSLGAADVNQRNLAFGKVIKLDGLDFVPSGASTTVERTTDNGACVAKIAGGGYLSARLALPEGAKVTKIVAYVYDNTANDVVVEFRRFGGKTSAGGATLRTGSTTGQSSAYRTVTYTGKPITVVHNGKYTYRLEVLLTNLSLGAHELCGARVEYTVR